MILVVAAKELVRGYRLWLGSLMAIVVASAVCAATLAQVETESTLSAKASASLQSTSWGVIVFSLLAAVSVTGATTNLAVTSGRRGYALLQLAGLLPRQVTAMVLAQLVMLAAVGTGLGVGLGSIFARRYWIWLLRRPVPLKALSSSMVAGLSGGRFACLLV